MATLTLDTAMCEDLRFQDLPPTLRYAVFEICCRLEQYSDGGLTDRQLRLHLLGPKRWERLTTDLLAWGWLRRGENGNLYRAGILSKDAIRMRELRAESERNMALAAEQKANRIRTESRTKSEQNPNKDPDSREHARPASLTDRQTDLQTGGDSDRLSDRPSDGQTRADARPPDLKFASEKSENPVRYPVDENDPADRKMLAALSEAQIPPDIAREVTGCIKPGQRFKIDYAIARARNLLKDRQAEAAATKRFDGMLHGALPGGDSPPGSQNGPAKSGYSNGHAHGSGFSTEAVVEEYIEQARREGRL